MPRFDRSTDVTFRDAPPAGTAPAVHPLQGGAPHLELRRPALPLPPIAEIPAGFDAIFQFRSDALDRQLTDHVKQSVGILHAFFEVEAAVLPAAVRDEIARRVLVAATTSIVLDPGGGAMVTPGSLDLDLDRYPLRVQLEYPRVLLLPPLVSHQIEPIEPSIRWTVRVDLGIPEIGAGTPPASPPSTGVGIGVGGGGSASGGSTAPPPGVGAGSGQTPASSAPVAGLRYVPLAHGRGFTSSRLERVTHAPRYQVWARLHLLDDGPVGLESTDLVFQALVSRGLSDAVDAALAPLSSHPDLQITPVMALGGLLRRGERLVGVRAFRAAMVAVPGNTREFQVLALGLNLGPPAETGDLGLVRPFVGDRRFGYYASLEVVRAVMALRWARPDTPRTVEADLPLQILLEDGSEIPVTGRVRFTFVGAPLIDLAPGEWGVPDSIRLAGEYEIEVLELRRPGEVVRGNDLGALRGPEVYPYVIRIHPFEDRTLPGGPAQGFLDDLGRRLTEPLYRPLLHPRPLRRLAGETSAPVRAVVLTGDLD